MMQYIPSPTEWVSKQVEEYESSGGRSGNMLRGMPVVLSHAAIACQTDPQPVRGELTSVEILIDRTSIEVFANHGEASTSTCFLPNDSGLSLKAANGAISLSEILIFQLNPAWKQESGIDVAKQPGDQTF